MKKLYFNLTKVSNGWVLKYSPFIGENSMTIENEEIYYKTLPEVYEFMSVHTKRVKEFDSAYLRHLFQE